MAHRSWLAVLVLDVADLDRAAAFWSAALRGRIVHQPFGEGIYLAVLVPTDGGETTLLLQKVPEPKTAKSRMHLDIASDDVAAEVARLMALGATRLRTVDERGVHFEVLADLDGNELCVVPGSRDDDWPAWP